VASGALAGEAGQHFSIRSQTLAEALKALSAAADEQLLFSAELVAGKRSPELNGTYTFPAALSHLLEGSGLTVDRTRSGVALIVRAPAPAVRTRSEPVTAAVETPKSSGGSAASIPVRHAEASSFGSITEVSITAARVPEAGFELPAPLATIGSDRIEQQAATNVVQVLNETAAFKATTTPTTNGVRAATPGASYADLRGLGSTRTLVLVDGKRFVPQIATALASYQVDLNQIPALLVERVETFTSGASAHWGSDAVAGVVNLVLRKDFQGFRTDVQAGASDYGDDQEYRVGVLAGTRLFGGRGHLEGAVDYVRNNGTGDVYTRPWGKAGYQLAGNPCSVLATAGQLAARGCDGSNGLAQMLILPGVRFGNIAPGGLILDTALRGTQFGPGGVPMPFQFGAYAAAGATMQGGDASNLRNNINTGITMANYVHRLGMYGRLSYDLTDQVSTYLEASVSSSAGGGQTLPSRDAGPMVNTIGIDNAFLPASIRDFMLESGIDAFQLGRVNRDIGYQQMRQDNDTLRVVAGLEGSLAGPWRWDASYVYGTNHYRLADAPNRIADHYRWAVDAVFDPAEGRVVCRSTLTDPGNGCQPLNLFGEGSPSQAAIDYVTAATWQDTQYRQHAASANLTGELFENWAGSVSLTAGVAYRAERQHSRVDPIADAQRYDSTNSRPLDGGFDVKEGYVRSMFPLLSGLRWAHSLSLNAGLRLVDYSTGAGTQWPWTVGLTYGPSEDLTLRIAKSRDIRAPNLFELHSLPISSTMNVAYNGLMLQVMQDASGNPDLHPERGSTFTVGASYRPPRIPGLQLSADYFEIDVRDIIAQRNLQQIANFCSLGTLPERAFNCALLTFSDGDEATRVPLRARVPYENLASSRRAGVDFSAAYGFELGGGSVSLNLGGNYVMHYQADFGTGPVERAGDLQGSPKLRGTFSLGYERSPVAVTAAARHTHRMLYDNTYVEGLQINDNTVPSTTYVDLSARYAASSSLQFFGVIRNALDKAPPYVPTAFGYPTSPVFYDMIGRTYRVGFRYELGD